jgi:glutathione S-transferase
MILIGQYDSPFVRRVGIALTLYGLPYRHEPWSGFGDTDKIARFNPLRRVPTLVMDDGVVMTDSAAMLEVLDDMVGPERAMMARTGPDRREGLRVCALACGTADKGVSLLYERALRETAFPFWVERCTGQINDTLTQLNADRANRHGEWWFGDKIGHADIVLATVLRFLGEALAGVIDLEDHTALAAHAARCEALPVFQAISQPFRLTPASA